ncbi:MAG: winged helix-turn-helix domain-containing protein, partial [Acidimicrobiales bacterium]
LRSRRLSYWVGSHEIVLQGRAAIVDGQFVALSELERALLGALVARPGALVGRQTLLRQVWRDRPAHPHVVETTVARLRAKLGPAGMAVETVVRRGYRLSSADEAADPTRVGGVDLDG